MIESNEIKPKDAAKASEPVSLMDGPDGVFLRGTFLGVEEARSWTPTGETRTVAIKPKLGLSVNGEDLEVVCRDDAQMVETRRGLVKGDRIELMVEALPPYGSKGAVTFSLPGAISRARRDWK